MKLPLAATVLILGVTIMLGWRNHGVLAGLRGEREQILAAARETNLSEEGGPIRHATGRARETPASRKAAIGELARMMVEVGRKASATGGPGSEITILQARIHETLLRLNKADARILLESLHKLEVDGVTGYSSHASEVIILLSESRPADAIALAKEMADRYSDEDQETEAIISNCLGSWAKREPLTALAWLRRHASSYSGLITPEMKCEVIGPVARLDPALAFRLAGEFGGAMDVPSANEIGATADSPAAREKILTSMRDFLKTVADPETRGDLSKTLLSGMFIRACDEGFDTASQWLETGGLSAHEVAAVLSEIRYRSRDDTARWLEWMGARFPEESKQSAGRLMKSWTQSDYPAATAWLESAPESPLKRQATATYAETVAPYHPAEAARWALTLEQGDERMRLLEKIHGAWKKKDEAAAAAFARQQGIEE